MQYNLAIKNIFQLFNKYDKKAFNMAFYYFKKEYISLSLLKKQYGPNYDGVGRVAIYNYLELNRLQIILMRFEKILKFSTKLFIQGKKESDIKKILDKKDDLALAKYIDNVLSGPKSKPKEFNLKQVLATFEMTTDTFKDALEHHNNNQEKIAFKYIYGIGVSKLDKEKVMGILNINESTLDKYLENVIANLDDIIYKYRQFINNYEQVEPEKRKATKKASIPSTKAPKKTEPKDDPPEQPPKKSSVKPPKSGSDKPKQPTKKETTKKETTKVIRKSKAPKEFIQYLADETISSEEKEVIKQQIQEFLKDEKVKQQKGYECARKYFDDDLSKAYIGSYKDKADGYRIRNLANSFTKYYKKTKTPKKPEYIIDYFIHAETSESDKQIIKDNLYVILAASEKSFPSTIPLLKRLYGDNYQNSKNEEIKLNRNNQAGIKNMINYIRKIFTEMKAKNYTSYDEYKNANKPKKAKKQKKPTCKNPAYKNPTYKNPTYREYFIDYFVLKTATAEEKEKVLKNLQSILSRYNKRYYKSAEYAKQLYGESLNEKRNESVINQINRSSFKVFVRNMKKHLNTINNAIYFVDFLDSAEKSAEEFEKYKSDLINALNSTYYATRTTVLRLKELFGENLDQEYNGIISRSERTTIQNYIKNVSKRMESGPKNTRAKKEFVNLLHTENMNEEEKKAHIEAVITKLRTMGDNRIVKIIQKYFGENFDQIYTGMYDKKDRSTLYCGIIRIEKNLNKSPSIRFKTYFLDNFKSDGYTEEECDFIKKHLPLINHHLKNNHPSLYPVLTSLYGDDLNQKKQEDKTGSLKEYHLLKYFMKANKEKILTEEFYYENPFNQIHYSLLTYFDCPLSDDEKRKRIAEYLEIKKTKAFRAYELVYEIFGQNFNNNTSENVIQPVAKQIIRDLILGINDFLNLKEEEYEAIINKYYKSLIEEVKDDSSLDDEIVKTIITRELIKVPELKTIIFNSYGEAFDKKYILRNIDSNYKKQVIEFIGRCKTRVATYNQKIRTRKNISVLENFLPDHLSKEERKERQKHLEFILSRKKSRSEGFEKIKQLIAEDLSIASVKDKKLCANVREQILLINKELDDFSYLKYLNRDEIIVSQVPDTLNGISSLILNFTNKYLNPEIVATKLSIPIAKVLETYFDYSDCIVMETLLNYVAHNYPEYLLKVLKSPKYEKLYTLLTPTEQQVIYLWLLNKGQTTIDYNYISQMVGVEVEAIKSYKVMSSDDDINRINNVLRYRKKM